MFPCWDEPAFRATFKLTVLTPGSHTAVSNMPIEHERLLGDGSKEVTFAGTPPMSSYLVAFASGEFEALSEEAEGVQLRILSTEGKREQGRYAMEKTKQLLAYYNRYFGIKYPLPKLDQVAVPAGFSGAMENWGAIFYEEPTLLFDESASPQLTKRDIYLTVAHEIAHQWFGNLVTMAWWDDLWLNEGFATWMESKTAEHFDPAWQVGLGACVTKSAVMSADARRTAHAIQKPIENESAANDAFDDITYQKGASLLTMLEDYLGEEPFRLGVQDYLSGRLYSNATTSDLWVALERASGKPIRHLAPCWTGQPGLPLVTVRTNCARGSQFVQITQERFTVEYPEARQLLWSVPVALAPVSNTEDRRYLLLDGLSASTNFPGCDELFIANPGDTGYYRVFYEAAQLERLIGLCATLPAADRLKLLNDVWALVEGGRVSAARCLECLSTLRHENKYSIWIQMLNCLEAMLTLQRGQKGSAAYQECARFLLRDTFNRLGWTPLSNESTSDGALRDAIIEMLGRCGDDAVAATAKERFAGFVTQPASLPADLRPAVMHICGRLADRAVYDELHRLALQSRGTEERQLYYGAMARAADTNLARATLELALSSELPPQEAAALVTQVANDGEHPELAWQFFQQHSKPLLARVDAFDRNKYVPSIFSAFSDLTRAAELEAYVRAHATPDAAPKAAESIEGIRLRAKMKQRELPAIDNWVASMLQERSSSSK
jgi:aminopeptidase N